MKRLLGTAAVLGLAFALAGAGAAAIQGRARAAGESALSGSITFEGVWTGAEARAFDAVLAGFRKLHPGVSVRYEPAGDQLPTALATAVAEGKPPDMASISQPGVVSQLVARGALKPIDFARGIVAASFPADIVRLGAIDGHLYGFLFKAANKSTVWYNVSAFRRAGVEPPRTWAQLLRVASRLKAAGIEAYSIGGADGWTLTDLFENVYLRQAGPARYTALAEHGIPWTDPSVKRALRTMAQVLGDSSNIVGGTAGALRTDFPTSVSNVFANPPKAAMVIEGDFVPGVAASSTKLKPGTGYGVFPFPSIAGSKGDVVVGGDTVVLFRDAPETRALVKYLATPAAAAIWARRGGFSSANRKLSPKAYPDAITRATATAIAGAKISRFDMSDQQPVSFGATVGQGEWQLFPDFLRDPSDVSGIASKLEAAAGEAYAKGR